MMAYAIADAVYNYKVAITGGRPMNIREMSQRVHAPASATISPLDVPTTYTPKIN